MNRLAFLLLFAVLGFSLLPMSSCRFDPLGVTDPGPVDTTGGDTTRTGIPCDPDTAYFSRDVLPILVSNCAIPGCHDAITREDGVQLADYQNVIRTGDVRAYNLSGSDLYEMITENRADKRMPPPPRARLTDEQIQVIARWIMQGARDLRCDESTECDLTQVSYSGTVQPILQQYCMGCHSAVLPSGGVSFGSHSGVQQVALNGRLVGVITHAAGYPAMPQGGGKLSACNIDRIRTWVERGAPND